MAKRIENRSFVIGFNWPTAFAAAGIAIIAPFLVRRLMPLLEGRLSDVSASDVMLAGKDSVRDAADDMNVGGLSGTVSRGVDRVVDHLKH
jgi:hypothetical protein